MKSLRLPEGQRSLMLGCLAGIKGRLPYTAQGAMMLNCRTTNHSLASPCSVCARLDPMPLKDFPDLVSGGGWFFCLQNNKLHFFVFKAVLRVAWLSINLAARGRIVKIDVEPHAVIVRFRDLCPRSSGRGLNSLAPTRMVVVVDDQPLG